VDQATQSQPIATSHEIETLADLGEYLHIAMQLEHATIPPYLTALYSIKPDTNPDAIHILRVVAVEEMLHLTIAANLLNAIGGTPDPTAKGFVPNYPAYLPDGENDFQVSLAPFSHALVDIVLQIERPNSAKGKLFRRTDADAGTTMLGARRREGELHYYSIGDFYAAIKKGFERLEAEAQSQGKTIFTGDPGRQINREYYYSGGGQLEAVVDLASASRGIRQIMEQGEGVEGGIYALDKELSHYYRFDQLNRGQYYQPGDKPNQPTGPTFTVDWEAAYPVKQDLKLAQIPAGSELHAMALAFNVAYAKFLETLKRAYNGEPGLLTSEAVPQMFAFRNLMVQLLRNPLPDDGRFHAAPTFEINLPDNTTAGAFAESGKHAVTPGVTATTTRLVRFLGFSSEVTAFTVFDLQGTGQAEAYLKAADDIVGNAVVDELLAVYGAPAEAEARDVYLRREIFGHEKLGPIARNIIKLWYSGTWYELPTAWTEAYGPAPKDVTFVVSAASYVEGLLWTAVGAHPAGAKAPGYGSWAAPPRISLPVLGKGH
jgi:Ferritin-like